MSVARRQIGVAGQPRIAIWCPACDCAHAVRVKPAPNPWEWNESLERPTFTPSILCRTPYPKNAPYRPAHLKPTDEAHICHSFVTDGKIRFLGDCTHAMAGKTVDLPAWPFAD